MPAGGFYIDASEWDRFAEKLLKASRGLVPEKGAFRPYMDEIAKEGARSTKLRAPDRYSSAKAGPGPRPSLRASIAGRGLPANARVVANWPTGALILQEFGGTSFWNKAGAGSIRKSNRAHRKVVEAAFRQGVRGHVIYRKPRKPRGYFIWNWPWYIRDFIGATLSRGMSEVARQYGIVIEPGGGRSLTGDMLNQNVPPRQ